MLPEGVQGTVTIDLKLSRKIVRTGSSSNYVSSSMLQSLLHSFDMAKRLIKSDKYRNQPARNYHGPRIQSYYVTVAMTIWQTCWSLQSMIVIQINIQSMLVSKC